jgi:hypothetical protein
MMDKDHDRKTLPAEDVLSTMDIKPHCEQFALFERCANILQTGASDTKLDEILGLIKQADVGFYLALGARARIHDRRQEVALLLLAVEMKRHPKLLEWKLVTHKIVPAANAKSPEQALYAAVIRLGSYNGGSELLCGSRTSRRAKNLLGIELLCRAKGIELSFVRAPEIYQYVAEMTQEELHEIVDQHSVRDCSGTEIGGGSALAPIASTTNANDTPPASDPLVISEGQVESEAPRVDNPGASLQLGATPGGQIMQSPAQPSFASLDKEITLGATCADLCRVIQKLPFLLEWHCSGENSCETQQRIVVAFGIVEDSVIRFHAAPATENRAAEILLSLVQESAEAKG